MSKKFYVKPAIVFPNEGIAVIPNTVVSANNRYSVSNYGRFFDNWNNKTEIYPYYTDINNPILYIDLDIFEGNKFVKKAFPAAFIVATIWGPYNEYGSRVVNYTTGNPLNISSANLGWAPDPIPGTATKTSAGTPGLRSKYKIPNVFLHSPELVRVVHSYIRQHPDMPHPEVLKNLGLYPTEYENNPEMMKAALIARRNELSRIRNKKSPYTRYLLNEPDIGKHPNAN